VNVVLAVPCFWPVDVVDLVDLLASVSVRTDGTVRTSCTYLLYFQVRARTRARARLELEPEPEPEPGA
jgi:hypothetical protein